MGEGKKDLIREFSAGGVVFKRKRSPLWLLIRPSGTDRWQLPKGQTDKGETSEEAAVREVTEEGGVEVRPIKKLGTSRYFFVFKGKRIFKTVVYFLMEYLGDTVSGHDREVEETLFLPFDEAFRKLTFKDDKEMLKEAMKAFREEVQENLV